MPVRLADYDMIPDASQCVDDVDSAPDSNRPVPFGRPEWIGPGGGGIHSGAHKEAGVEYDSGPRTSSDIQTNTWNGGRGVYFRDPNGHLLELLTRDYA